MKFITIGLAALLALAPVSAADTSEEESGHFCNAFAPPYDAWCWFIVNSGYCEYFAEPFSSWCRGDLPCEYFAEPFSSWCQGDIDLPCEIFADPFYTICKQLEP